MTLARLIRDRGALQGSNFPCRSADYLSVSRLAVRCPHRPSLVLHGRLRPRPVCLLSPLPEIFPSGWGRGNVPMPTVYSASAMPNRFITRITVIAPLRWVGGNVPMGAVYSSFLHSAAMPNCFIARMTATGLQASPPRGVLMPRSVSACAISR